MGGRRCRLAIFDFDGTLADSSRAISSTLNRVLEDLGLPPVPEREIHARIGLSFEAMLPEIVGTGPGEELYERIVEGYVQAARNGSFRGVKLFEGIREVLEALHGGGILCAVATGKSAPSLQASLEETGIGAFFSSLATCDRVARPKPWPDMVELVLEETGMPEGEALLIGDTSFDMEMGRAASVRTCGVGWGNHGLPALREEGADFLVERPLELLGLFLP